jgi:excisionase family DNA binding protein
LWLKKNAGHGTCATLFREANMGTQEPMNANQGNTPAAPNLQPEFVNLSQAAQYIGSTRRFLELKIADQELKVFRPSRRLVRIRLTELERWIESYSSKGGAA